MPKPSQERELTEADLVAIGYSRDAAAQICSLLSSKEQLDWYVQKGKQHNCYPITRVSDGYPYSLRKKLGMDCPGSLWAKGDETILGLPGIALVGSRDLRPANSDFAREAGKQAALQGYALISGNARGADRTAQESCLAHGGKVISIVADALEKCPVRENVLYLSEDGFDLPFSAHRALSRNYVIHCLAQKVLVAQCGAGKGGTWSGTSKNLRHNWTPVFYFDDSSSAARTLGQMGAVGICMEDLENLNRLQPNFMNFIDQ